MDHPSYRDRQDIISLYSCHDLPYLDYNQDLSCFQKKYQFCNCFTLSPRRTILVSLVMVVWILPAHCVPKLSTSPTCIYASCFLLEPPISPPLIFHHSPCTTTSAQPASTTYPPTSSYGCLTHTTILVCSPVAPDHVDLLYPYRCNTLAYPHHPVRAAQLRYSCRCQG